ncbi:MAG: hypothetical protein KA105_06415 [Caulobacter sp.]|nr:hypothetical protein [Caulobacter sp.]
MNQTTVTPETLQTFGADRGIALFGYGLLFASVFLMGFTGVAALIIAYVTRGQASPGVRRHLNAQIGMFWTGLFLAVVAIGLTVAGVWLLVDDVWRASPGAVAEADIWKTVTTHFSLVAKDSRLLILFLGALIALAAHVVWGLAAPAIGFLRLATTDPKGVTAEP